MAELVIRPVRTRRDLKRFVKVPFGLHRDNSLWVPPLIYDRMQFLNRAKNPYFEHAEAEYFIAERGGEPVGRITAQIDRRWDEFHGPGTGMFGFFESVNDPEVAGALLDTAAGWLRERGRTRILGPMDFTTNDEVGILIEGYDRAPMILQNWHPPYYRELLETHGYDKAMDLLMWWLELGDLKQGSEFHPMIHQAAVESRDKHGIAVRNMRKRDMAAEVARFAGVYNEAWGENWGFVPMTDAEVEFHAKILKQVIDEKWALIAEAPNGEVAGAALTLPDINQVLAKMNGRLLPFGWLRFLLGKRKINRVRVFALGVRNDYQHAGVAAALYIRHLDNADPDGVPAGECGWILEVNDPMNRAMEGMGGEVIKRYRLFERQL
ncbi:MAG TPA: hypothetical protein VFD37_00475 [Solirubrobacterales bacterium]|nr:hypothetical protein [Solirubrobacterales bacterium]